jgi:predicted Rossmann-fold nucleotide-binding protein
MLSEQLMRTSLALILTVATGAACQSKGPFGGSRPTRADEPLTISLSPDRCDGDRTPFVPFDQVPTAEDLAVDSYCSELFLSRYAPGGFVTIFGSSRLKDGTPEYDDVWNFAFTWTMQHPDLPVMTGGGPGIMEGGNRGAAEAGGQSLGFGTYFKGADDAFNQWVTQGYMFADFEVRERALLKYARAALIFPGGVGTGWELFMTISEVQTHRMSPIPIVVVGQPMAQAFGPYLDWMAQRGTIDPADRNLIKIVDSAQDAVDYLNANLPDVLGGDPGQQPQD